MSQDTLQRFLFDAAPVRGEIVRLDHTWREVLIRRQYPVPLQKLMGELLAAASLLSAMLKFDGSLIMQLHGDGAVKLIVIECEADMTMRATARWDENVEIEDKPLPDLLGHGKFVITLDPREGGQAYQGIVGLQGGSIAAIIEHYMQSSQQLDTRLWLACDGQTSAGLMVQRLPAGHGDPDGWNRISLLADTITPAELLSLAPTEVLQRLFHEETVRLMAEDHPHFGCRCSRERVINMLRMMGLEEVEAILAERGQIDVSCEFCHQAYCFDAVDAAQVFASDAVIEAPTTRQ
ncbi:Hsp33 family molecular chaperone HslO [Chitinimonas lacunae]|uniref:Hsp33 family molecular chaperone HslO n=1 Tax=Chitinimonas lacunae TaxID=1963018 RepID=A0ABV8MQJ1_9NEIS